MMPVLSTSYDCTELQDYCPCHIRYDPSSDADRAQCSQGTVKTGLTRRFVAKGIVHIIVYTNANFTNMNMKCYAKSDGRTMKM